MTDRAVRMWEFWGSELPNKELDWGGINAKADGSAVFGDGVNPDKLADAMNRIGGWRAGWWDMTPEERRCHIEDAENFNLVHKIFLTLGRNQSAIMFALYAEKAGSVRNAVRMANEALQALPKVVRWYDSPNYDENGKLISRGYTYTEEVKLISAERAQIAHDWVIQHTEDNFRVFIKNKKKQRAMNFEARSLKEVTG